MQYLSTPVPCQPSLAHMQPLRRRYGPGSGAQYLLYYNVGVYMGAPIDLKIMSVSLSNAAGGVNTSPGGYASASTAYTNMYSAYAGYIGLYSGWKATVTFQIQDRAGNPLELPGFYFTFLDIDSVYEAITVGNGGARYIISTDSNLAVTSNAYSTTFSSSTSSDVVDIPTDATTMNEAQQKHAVTLMYRSTSRFTVTLGNSMSSSEDEWKLRYYWFGGISNLVTLSPPPPPPSPPPFPPPFPPPPCQTKTYGSCAGSATCCISPGTVGYYQGMRTTEWECRARGVYGGAPGSEQCVPKDTSATPSPAPSAAPTPTPVGGACQAKPFGGCGGAVFPTCCIPSGTFGTDKTTDVRTDIWACRSWMGRTYSQCVPTSTTPPDPVVASPPPPSTVRGCQSSAYGACGGSKWCCVDTVGYVGEIQTSKWSCRAWKGRNYNQCLPEVAPNPPPFPPPMPPA